AAELLVPKVKHARATAAVARRVAATPGRLAVVGLGPDGREHLTVHARRRLLEADVVLGYQPYVEQVRQWLPATPTEPSAIGQEHERARRALDLALGGQRVALVSSGDPGIYGMAGLVLEELDARGLADRCADLVEVVPGVTAAGAARGAGGHVDPGAGGRRRHASAGAVAGRPAGWREVTAPRGRRDRHFRSPPDVRTCGR